MIVGMVHQQKCFNKNGALFDPNAYQIGEDLQYPFELLRSLGEAESIDFCTIDKYPPERYDMVICFDPPNAEYIELNSIVERGIPKILVLLESMVVQPNNYKVESHIAYRKIYTWNDDLVDNQKYWMLRLPNKIPNSLSFDIAAKQCKAVMIAGNKKSAFANELYSKRLDEIRWCSLNRPNALDLYGIGWDEREFTGYFRLLNRFPVLKKLFRPTPPTSWKGRIKSKSEVLKKYKFSIAYENVAGVNGYLTEKLFDSLFSLCIPVYWGAPNINNLVPKMCYVDRATFSSSIELFDYLQSMSNDEYSKRVESIKEFVLGREIKPFSANQFAETLLAEVGNYRKK